MTPLQQRVMYDERFQNACHRYVHDGGSSGAIASVAVSIIASEARLINDDLLTALEIVLDHLTGNTLKYGRDRAIAVASAAISKARGAA